MTTSESVSDRFRELLYQKDVSIYELSMKYGISQGTLNSLFYNRNNGVNLKTVFIILRELKVQVLEFFDSENFEDLNKIDLD